MDMHAEFLTQTLMLNLKMFIGITVEEYRDHHHVWLSYPRTNFSLHIILIHGATEIYLFQKFWSKFDMKQLNVESMKLRYEMVLIS